MPPEREQIAAHRSGPRFRPALPSSIGRIVSDTTDRQRPVTGADILLETLESCGVSVLFGYPGGAIMPVYDALLESRLRHILVRHEQAAALAANGYARHTGQLGVCLSTSGPGATNLITGIADAHLDSVPLLAITGQVSTSVMGTDAFQEVDTFGLTMPIVKHSVVLRNPADIASTVREACRIATSGRPGPVLLDLPKDVASATVTDSARSATTPSSATTPPVNHAALARARRLLVESTRPVLYTGYGVGLDGAEQALRELVAHSGIPVVSTLKGLGGLPTDDPAFLGMIGMHGTRAANLAVQECDLLICVGARFDDRVTGRLADFAPHARVIHLDTDASEISKLRYAHVPVVGPLAPSLAALHVPRAHEAWRSHCARLRSGSQPRYDAPGDAVHAPSLLRHLSRIAPRNTVFTCDVGQHQMWVAQHVTHRSISQHLTSGGLGTMGFGLPAALGVKIARPDTPVVCVTGDGSIMMNIQELATLRRYGAAVKIVLIDNKALGMVRQWQQLFFAERYSEIDLSDNPDFVAVARAFGIEAARVDCRAEVDAQLRAMLASDGPFLLHVPIEMATNVWPLVPPNSPNHHQLEEPHHV